MKWPRISTAKFGALLLGILGAVKLYKGVHDGDSALIQQGAAELGGALGINGIRNKQERIAPDETTGAP